MTIDCLNDEIEFLKREYAAAVDRKNKIGLRKDTRYMKILEHCVKILEKEKRELV